MELAAEIEIHPLVEKCKQGDTRSYSELYQQYSRAMFSTCYRLLNNIADAEDVLQESFTDAFRHLHHFEYKSSFGAWLKQIVINKCVNHLRQKKMILVDLEKSPITHLPDDDPEDEEKIFLQVAAIKRAVQELPTGYRTVLCLYLLEGYDHDEIADILGVASSTTRSQYKRAKGKIITDFKRRRQIMSRIENMIRENREAFDSYEPGNQVWDNIQKNLDKKPGKVTHLKSKFWKWTAAAAVFLLAFTAWYQFRESPTPVTKPEVATEENLPDEYAEEVYHFTKLISLKHKELQKLRKEEPELYEQFAGDIKILDSSYHSLQEQMPGNPNKETLIQAMIQNLQLQIELLNKQLMITEQIKQKKSKNHVSTYKTL